MPSVETAVGEPLWTVPLFTRHSAWSTPEAASVPVSASASVAVCHVTGAAALVLAGATVSTRMSSIFQPDVWPALSSARWLMR